MNLKEIQRRLSHKRMEITTRKHIHATDEILKQSLEFMNRMYQAT